MPRLDPKLLYRRLGSLFGTLDASRTPRAAVHSFLCQALDTLGADLRLQAGMLYGESRDRFDLLETVGPVEGAVAEKVDAAARPWTLALHHGVYIFADPDHPDAPPGHGIVPRQPCAAVVIGRRPDRHVLLFLLADGWMREELDFALNTIRAALGSRFMEERVRGTFLQAAEIQQSLLLDEPPAFPGYEMAARSVPAEEVGGDFYDFVAFDDELMGLAIGDASGHGLPAALLVRDVVTGLRMGLEKNLKMVEVFSKLNRVIHRSSLSSRFISVFYGELEPGGMLLYVNAGHQPPLLVGAERVLALDRGGTVIGPLPEVRFQRGVAVLDPGDALVMVTDGILERRDQEGAFFGDERLLALAREARATTAEESVARIFAAAWSFGNERPWEDDATVVVVRRTPVAEPPGPRR